MGIYWIDKEESANLMNQDLRFLFSGSLSQVSVIVVVVQMVNAAFIVDPSTNKVFATTEEPKLFYDGVSCLNPWGWSNQKSCDSWHPLRHASIVAIEGSSTRDRNLFPGYLNFIMWGTKSFLSSWPNQVHKATTRVGLMTIRSLTLHKRCHTELSRPYLCTGFDIYLIWEPCAMHAMGLVHQRIKRLIHAFPNPNAGALGSVHRLQGEKSLNHHYAVFKVL
ncbi:hypothetical protein R6Q57_018384 [Mikania cordata]